MRDVSERCPALLLQSRAHSRHTVDFPRLSQKQEGLLSNVVCVFVLFEPRLNQKCGFVEWHNDTNQAFDPEKN